MTAPTKICVLHLNLCTEYFMGIRDGNKPFEYREVKPYWIKRLAKEYDQVWFHWGYKKATDETVIKRKFVKPEIVTRSHKHWGNDRKSLFAIPTGIRVEGSVL